jgi:hypothetical protein
LEALLEQLRSTPLDPSRPALDLLEDLLSGIYGCALLYREYEAGQEIDDESFEAGSIADAGVVAIEDLAVVDLEGVEDVVGLMLSQTGAVQTGADSVDVGEAADFVDEEVDDEDGDWPEVGSQEFLDAVRAEAAEQSARLY